nr:hypothetical protein [Allobaculum sp. Allo2]
MQPGFDFSGQIVAGLQFVERKGFRFQKGSFFEPIGNASRIGADQAAFALKRTAKIADDHGADFIGFAVSQHIQHWSSGCSSGFAVVAGMGERADFYGAAAVRRIRVFLLICAMNSRASGIVFTR